MCIVCEMKSIVAGLSEDLQAEILMRTEVLAGALQETMTQVSEVLVQGASPVLLLETASAVQTLLTDLPHAVKARNKAYEEMRKERQQETAVNTEFRYH